VGTLLPSPNAVFIFFVNKKSLSSPPPRFPFFTNIRTQWSHPQKSGSYLGHACAREPLKSTTQVQAGSHSRIKDTTQSSFPTSFFQKHLQTINHVYNRTVSSSPQHFLGHFLKSPSLAFSNCELRSVASWIERSKAQAGPTKKKPESRPRSAN